MFPLLLLLLVQSLSATQFPALTQHIGLVWNDKDISSSIDTSQTISIADGSVPTFTICGAFKTEQKDVSCKVDYSTQKRGNNSFSSVSSITYNTAQYLSEGINSQGNSYTCMAFRNTIPDFATVYNGVSSSDSITDWKVTYTCPSEFPWSSIFGGIGAFILSIFVCCCCCCFCCFKLFQNKQAKKITQQRDYRAFNPNDSVISYHPGNPQYGAPGYAANGQYGRPL